MIIQDHMQRVESVLENATHCIQQCCDEETCVALSITPTETGDICVHFLCPPESQCPIELESVAESLSIVLNARTNQTESSTVNYLDLDSDSTEVVSDAAPTGNLTGVLLDGANGTTNTLVDRVNRTIAALVDSSIGQAILSAALNPSETLNGVAGDVQEELEEEDVASGANAFLTQLSITITAFGLVLAGVLLCLFAVGLKQTVRRVPYQQL